MKFCFDLETSPLPLEQLLPIMPELKPNGTLKDPDKIKVDLELKRHAWLGDCALKATTGRIIAVGARKDDQEPEFDCTPDERTMLDVLYFNIQDTIANHGQVYAWNLFGFDLPFFCQRCAVHGIPAFQNLTSNFHGRWAWREAFVDPMQVWCGPYQRSDGASLKAVGFALGLGVKSGNGKDFAALLKSDPVAAKNYCLEDVRLLSGIVAKMGI